MTKNGVLTLRHTGYWCSKPSEVFPEKRDHRKCKEHPFKWVGFMLSGQTKLVCVCPCHRKKGKSARKPS